MKLATMLDESRDGRLAVVSKNLQQAVWSPANWPTLQSALDKWAQSEPVLRRLAQELEDGQRTDAFPLDPSKAAAPLPRAYQWLDASAFLHHGELMQHALGFKNQPPNPSLLMYQGASDHMLGPHADICLADVSHEIDFESEVGVIVDDVPMCCTAAAAEAHIKLLVLINDISLRVYAPQEMKRGFGFLQAKPASSFAPAAVTPDELGSAWANGRMHLPILTRRDGVWFGAPDAGEMDFGFPQLIEYAARHRNLTAGTIIGSGTVSNRDRARGSSCIMERRALETIATGAAVTQFMQSGDQVRIEVLSHTGQSIFGAIDQYVTPAVNF